MARSSCWTDVNAKGDEFFHKCFWGRLHGYVLDFTLLWQWDLGVSVWLAWLFFCTHIWDCPHLSQSNFNEWKEILHIVFKLALYTKTFYYSRWTLFYFWGKAGHFNMGICRDSLTLESTQVVIGGTAVFYTFVFHLYPPALVAWGPRHLPHPL